MDGCIRGKGSPPWPPDTTLGPSLEGGGAGTWDGWGGKINSAAKSQPIRLWGSDGFGGTQPWWEHGPESGQRGQGSTVLQWGAPPRTLNSPPHTHEHPPLCAILSSSRALGWHPWVLVAPEGWGFLLGGRGGRWGVLPRDVAVGGRCRWAGGTPRLQPWCGDPWGPVHPLQVMGRGGASGSPPPHR